MTPPTTDNPGSRPDAPAAGASTTSAPALAPAPALSAARREMARSVSSLSISRMQRPGGGGGGQPAGPGRRIPWIPIIVIALLGGAGWLFRDRIQDFADKVGKMGETNETPKLRTIPVVQQTGGGPPPVLIAGGKIVSDQKVFVSTKVSGQIIEMLVEQNDRVVKDKTVIARIEKTDYIARHAQAKANHEKAVADTLRIRSETDRFRADIARAKAEVRRFEAEIGKAKSEVKRTEIEIRRAEEEIAQSEADRNRFEVLFKNALAKWSDTDGMRRDRAATAFELRDAESARDAAKAQVSWSEAQLSVTRRRKLGAEAAHEVAEASVLAAAEAKSAAEAAVDSAEAALATAQANITVFEATTRAAQAVLELEAKHLADTEVLAPITGVVLERNANVGDFVAAEGGRGGIANSQFVTLADTANIRVEVDITEQDINKLEKDMPCTIIPDAYKDRVYKGKIMWIDPLGNYSKATVQVKVRIFEPDERLRIEGACKVEFRPKPPPGSAPAAEDKPAIWIPLSAVKEPDGKSRVQVLDGNVIRVLFVSLGQVSGRQVKVVAGLKPGQNLVAEFDDNLKDGQVYVPPPEK